MVDQIKISGTPEKDAIAETDFVVGNVGTTTDATGRVTVPALRTRLNIGDQDIVGDVDITGDQEVSGHSKAATLEGDGALVTGVLTAGTGGTSSESSLSLVCDSGGANPLSKFAFSKNGVPIADLDENSFAPKTGIPYSHADDAIPFAKDLDLQGNLTVRDQGKQDIQPFQALLFREGEGDAVTVPDHASFSNLSCGFTYVCAYNALTAGESDSGYFFYKIHRLIFSSSSGKITFLAIFSGSNGEWESASAIDIANDSVVGVSYDGSSTSSHPTVYINGVPVVMVQNSVPTGAITTDIGVDLVFGNNSVGTSGFDGLLKSESLHNEAKSSDWLKKHTSNPNMAIAPIDGGGSNVAQNVSTCVNDNYTTFVNETATGFDATSNGAATHRAATADEITFIKGKKYLVTFDLVLNSGAAPVFGLRTAVGGSEISDEAQVAASAGSNSQVFTCNTTTTGVVRFLNASTATDYEVTNLDTHQLGCTYRAKPQDIIGTASTPTFWKDSSGNGNHGAITGGEVVNRSYTETTFESTSVVTVKLGGASAGIVQSTTFCKEIKKGKMVDVFLNVNFDKGVASTGALTIEGLRYTSDSTANNFCVVDLYANRIGAAGETIEAFIAPGSSLISFRQVPQGTGAATPTDDTDIIATGTDATMIINARYEVDE